MSKIVIIEAGESLPFDFNRGANSIDGWVCTIVLKQKPSDTPILSRVIPPVGDSWPGFLTQSETAPLASGEYFLAAQLVNAVNDEEEVIRERSRFKITEAWT